MEFHIISNPGGYFHMYCSFIVVFFCKGTKLTYQRKLVRSRERFSSEVSPNCMPFPSGEYSPIPNKGLQSTITLELQTIIKNTSVLSRLNFNLFYLIQSVTDFRQMFKEIAPFPEDITNLGSSASFSSISPTVYVETEKHWRHNRILRDIK